jgi:hypothetical protein
MVERERAILQERLGEVSGHYVDRCRGYNALREQLSVTKLAITDLLVSAKAGGAGGGGAGAGTHREITIPSDVWNCFVGSGVLKEPAKLPETTFPFTAEFKAGDSEVSGRCSLCFTRKGAVVYLPASEWDTHIREHHP